MHARSDGKPTGETGLTKICIVLGKMILAKWNSSPSLETMNNAPIQKPFRPPSRRTQFSFFSLRGNRVYLTGTFNDWSPDSIEMKGTGDGHFKQWLELPEGHHEYKFVVDDTWTADPACPHWKPNKHGSLNSIIHIPN